MISKTKISKRLKRKTNPELAKAIEWAKKNDFLELAKKYASRIVGIKDGEIIFNDHIKKMNDMDLINIYGETKDWYLNGKF